MNSQIPAVVVGLCTHGLAICRSLGRKGIPVYALESNKGLPGLKTRYARKTLVSNINGPELIDDLVEVCNEFDEKPVLFLTNDNMVRTVAKFYDKINKLYRINWPPHDLVLKLLEKTTLADYVKSKGLLYPKTFTISCIKDLDDLKSLLQYPIALKPSAPLSPFKALEIGNENELRQQIVRYQTKVSCFLLQEWIPGTERNIYFSNFYFDKEYNPIASFVGRKIRSHPRNTGGACSAEPSDRNDLLETSLKFFKDLPIRGPASLEIKEDGKGHQYIIEPTIGRFDFYILCCIVNGVDMPYISYAYQTGNRKVESNKKKNNTIWLDFELDFPVYLESLKDKNERRDALSFLFRRKAFALMAWDDISPSLSAWPKELKRYFQKLKKIVKKLFRKI